MCTCMSTYRYRKCVHVYIYIYVHIHIHIHVYMYLHTHICSPRAWTLDGFRATARPELGFRAGGLERKTGIISPNCDAVAICSPPNMGSEHTYTYIDIYIR